MGTLSSPRMILTTVDPDYGGGEDEFVCSNCGSMFPRDAVKELIEAHLNDCEEIKTPFLWEVTKFADDEVEYEGDERLYKLTCNGRTVFIGTSNHFIGFENLNLWQVSPFERVSEEYIYKYDFRNHLKNQLEFVLRDANELTEQIVDCKEIIGRGAKYLPTNVATAYVDALAKVDASIIAAKQALEGIKSITGSESFYRL